MSKPTLLLYAPAPASWEPRLRQLCAVQGLRLRVVEQCDLSRTVGALAQGLAPAGEIPAADALPEPMLVFCALSGAQLDRLLQNLRRLEVPRSVLKAVLTPDNAGWTFSALYRELCRERLAMSRNSPVHPDGAPSSVPLGRPPQNS